MEQTSSASEIQQLQPTQQAAQTAQAAQREDIQQTEQAAEQTAEQQKLAALQAVADTLAAHYGVDADRADALQEAFLQDTARGSAIAGKAARQAAFRGAMGEYIALLRQADSLRAKYPGFDLPALCGDKRFVALLQAGADMEEAYASLHHKQLLTAAVQHTAQLVANGMRAALAGQKRRPREGAMTAGSTAVGKVDPAGMTRAQREAIAKRVLKGEKVIL